MPMPAPSLLRRLDIRFMDVVVFVELMLLAITYSRLFTFFPQLASPIRLGAAIIPLLFVPPALFLRPLAALVTIAIVAILFGYQLWFSAIWGTAFTGSALGAFQGLLLSAMFAIHARGRDPSRVLAIFFITCIVYLLMYLYYLKTIDASSISIQQSRGQGDFAASIARTHASKNGDTDVNEYKLAVSGTHLSFAFLYAVGWASLAKAPLGRMVAAALVVFTGYCLWVSDSRFNTFVTLLAVGSMLIPLLPWRKAYIYFGIAVAGMFAYTVMAFADINPFLLIASDQSGATRAQEYVAANPTFLSVPFLGTGLWNTGEDLTIPYGGASVAPSDFGWYGELLQHGMIGLVLLAFCHFMIALLISRISRDGVSKLTLRILAAAACYLTLVQFLSPQLWEGAGSIVVSLVGAYLTMRAIRARPARPAPAGGKGNMDGAPLGSA